MKKALTFLAVLLLFTQVVCFAETYTLAEAKKMFKYAQGLFDAQEYSLAKEVYLKIVHLYPKSNLTAKSQYRVGECLEHQNNMRFAIKEWGKLIKKYPKSNLVQKTKKKIEYAKKYLQNDDLPILTLEERLADRYITWGNYSRDRILSWPNEFFRRYNEFDTAMEWYNKAIKISPRKHIKAKAQFRKAELCINIARPNPYQQYTGRMRKETKDYIMRGIKEYQIVIDSYTNTYWTDQARMRIFDIYRDSLRDKESAKKACHDNISYYKSKGSIKDHYYATYYRGQLEYFKTLFDEENEVVVHSMQKWEMPLQSTKEKLANEYIWIGRDFAEKSVYWGEYGAVYKEEKLDAALHYYDEVIKLCPGDELAAQAQYRKGEAYLKQSRQADDKKAVKEFKKVLDDYPNSHYADEAGIKMGDIYLENLKDKRGAIEAYKQLIRIRNKDMNNYYVRLALTEIQYLGGSLDFLKEDKK